MVIDHSLAPRFVPVRRPVMFPAPPYRLLVQWGKRKLHLRGPRLHVAMVHLYLRCGGLFVPNYQLPPKLRRSSR